MSDSSPAETMKRAAALIRERARELPPLPWRAEGRDVLATQDYNPGGAGWDPDWDQAFNVAVCPRQDEAEYVASMHPLIGAALAGLLDKVAWAVTINPDLIARVGYGEVLALARAYLGEADPS